MAAGKTIAQAIPPAARQGVYRVLEILDQWPLDAHFRGAYCYITHAGEPLCRLRFRGRKDKWHFAIFRYSRGTYGSPDLGPESGSVDDCLRFALGAYGLLPCLSTLEGNMSVIDRLR